MADDSTPMQATGPLFDEINRRLADAIGEAIQNGADAQAAIGAAVITASDFAVLVFGEEALDDLKATLEMQRGQKMLELGG
jgi:ATP-dependent exoDNAse (exonuclease V) beta subunit